MKPINFATLLIPSILPLVALSNIVGCDGYADLPLQLRERGDLSIVSVERFATGPGRVEILLEPPNDALGPFAIVGHPAVLSDGARVASWAFGRCSGETSGPLALCLSVATTTAEPIVLALVLESRGDGRRFTLIGEEASP